MTDDTLEELLAGWKEQTVTTRQALDQLLRVLRTLDEHVRVLERRLAASSRPPAPPPTRTKRKKK